MSELVLCEAVSETTSLLTINRPEALNALNMKVLAALNEAIAGAQRSGSRQLIITGAGPKSFVAGADIAAMAQLDPKQAHQFARFGQRVLHRLTRYPGVTIAAVNGFALGGGMELAMACDLILCSENARFGQPEVGLGVIPGFGGTQRLVRLVGGQVARELCFTGRHVKAEEAVRLGVALRAVAPEQLLDEAKKLAETIGQQGPQAVRWAKAACAAADDLSLETGLQEEAELFARCFSTDDQTEGMAAFLEKRKPAFKGR